MATINDAARGRFVVLDTETTGLSLGAEICQLAIVGDDGAVLFDSLIKPKNPIPAEATRIHGITNADVAGAPTWQDCQPQVLALLTDSAVMVYNATFDRGMLHKSADAWSMPKTDWKALSPWFCVMTHFAAVYGEWNDYHGNYKWQPLWRALKHYGLEFEGQQHSALGDAQATLALIRAMQKAGTL